MQEIRKALKITFSKPSVWIIFILLTLMMVALFGILENIASIWAYLGLSSSIEQKIFFIFKLLIGLSSSIGFFHLFTTIVLLALLSLNFTMFITLYRKAHHIYGAGHVVTTSLLGFVVSLMGIGCFSCGAFVLAYVLSFLGIGSLAFFLPFHGFEFIFLGALFLIYSLYKLAKKLIDIDTHTK